MKILKGVLTAITIIIFIVFSLESWYSWKRKKEEPFRLGVNAFKSGDDDLAYEYLLPYAEAGNASAQRMLGEIYAFGLGRESNILRAKMWFRKADCKEPRNGESEYFVALDFLDEEHLAPIDTAKALEWLQIAAEAGNPKAQIILTDQAKQAAMNLSVPKEIVDQWRKFLGYPEN